MFRRSYRIISAGQLKSVQKFVAGNGMGVKGNLLFLRSCSSSSSSSSRAKVDAQNTTQLSKKLLDEDEYDDYDNAKTVTQKIRWFGVVFMRLGFLLLGSYCVYVVGVELFPGRMGPNNLFNAAFEKVRYNAEVISMVGENMKAFGRDVGRNTEGRRNHIEQYKYTAEDGSKRTRVRFNVQGSQGKAVVYAEVADSLQAGDLVYLICQDSRTGRVHTIVDNREMLDSRDSSSSSASGNSFMQLFQSKASS